MTHDPIDSDTSRMLRQILSPAEAQSLVLPPPTHVRGNGPAESTPLTGNLANPPSQATPSRQGLAGYFATATAPAPAGTADDRSNLGYVRVVSFGQVGYLPRASLGAARQIDRNLQVLVE
jgi:hypothetical protein